MCSIISSPFSNFFLSSSLRVSRKFMNFTISLKYLFFIFVNLILKFGYYNFEFFNYLWFVRP